MGFDHESRVARLVIADLTYENENMQSRLRDLIIQNESREAEVLRLMRRNHRLSAMHTVLFRDTRAQMRRVARLEAVVRFLINMYPDIIVIDDAAVEFLTGLSVEVPEKDFFNHRDAVVERFIDTCGRIAARSRMSSTGTVTDQDLRGTDEAGVQSLGLRRLCSSSVGDL